MAQEPKVDRGGLYLVFAGVVFLLLSEGVTFLVAGTLLMGRGLGYAVGVGIGVGIVSLLIAGALESLAKRAAQPALRFLAPALFLAGALACGGFLMLPLLHRSNESFGYRGDYQVEYSNGRTERVAGSQLGREAWEGYAGAATGATLSLLLCGLWMGVGAAGRPRGDGDSERRVP